MTRIEGTIIVGISGKRGSGKDTAADYLIKHCRCGKMAFADPLKSAAIAMFGFTHAQVYGDLKGTVDSFWGFTPGWALQKLGTEGGRQVFGQDFWVRAMERRLRATGQGGRYVIADVRFPEEAEAIKAWGGMLIRIKRPNYSVDDGRDSQHVSETALDDYEGWDAVIQNTGTREDLWGNMKRIVG